ncbi:hypothetical protein FL857_00440 [Criibacterium bergeronii]|uniref:Uncharacterized protein n=1 Tax=Criibacterium bergeronii TaxID=1871336 RepID=A0A552VDM8_9FIRM|nr:hypothetical protein [Criibacterium bergeronii]TRW28588.1 hypothetical protein FL857_00440 [Criibacterium bergeronii]
MNVSFINNTYMNYSRSKLNGNLIGVKQNDQEDKRKTLSAETLRGLSELQIKNEVTKNYYENSFVKNKDEQNQPKTPLQQALEQMKKSQEAQEEHEKQEKISKKIARGEATPEEEAYLAEKNPELHQKATIAKKNTQEVKNALKKARTKQEAQSIISTAKTLALSVLEKDMTLGELMMEGINKVEKDFRKENPKLKDDTMLDEFKTFTIDKVRAKAIQRYKNNMNTYMG